MEYEIFVSGIGGQGIQLVSKMLALAGSAEDRHVMLNGLYGGEMRGGMSMSTVVIGDAPLLALPVTASAGAAVVLHHHFWERPRSRLRRGALVVADSEVASNLGEMPELTLVTVPATDLARSVGNPMVSGMILMAAFNAMTGLVAEQSLLAAMRKLVPSHRRQHLESNEKALMAGARAVEALSHPIALAKKKQEAAA